VDALVPQLVQVHVVFFAVFAGAAASGTPANIPLIMAMSRIKTPVFLKRVPDFMVNSTSLLPRASTLTDNSTAMLPIEPLFCKSISILFFKFFCHNLMR
jgi:hypothetical protein